MRLAALHGSWRSAILAIHQAAWTPPDTSRLEENPQPSERHGMDQGPCRSTHQGTCRFTMSIQDILIPLQYNLNEINTKLGPHEDDWDSGSTLTVVYRRVLRVKLCELWKQNSYLRNLEYF